MFTAQEYKRPQSLQEAWELNQKKSARILAGGCWLRLGRQRIGTLVDLCGLGLEGISLEGDRIAVGAMTTLRQLETSPLLREAYGDYFREMVKGIVGVQFRNCATVGGSLASRFGFSDLLTGFLAADCRVTLFKAGELPLEEYAALAPDRDLLVKVTVPAGGVRAVYQSVRNTRTDLPVLTCAASRREGEEGLRMAVGARPGKAVLLRGVTRDNCPARLEELSFGSNMRAGADYRRHLAGVLSRRALAQLEEGER